MIPAQFETEYEDYHATSRARRISRRSVLLELEAMAGLPLLEIEAEGIREYLGALLAKGQHVNTVTKKLSLIGPFYRWAWDAKLLDAERLMRIQAIRPPRGGGRYVPRPYTRKELDRFWIALDKRYPIVDPYYWRRWRRGTSHFRRIQPHAMRIQIEAIVALALYCGLRRTEIASLAIDDFHYDNAYVVVRQRGQRTNGKNRTREVPHTKASRAAVQAWIELRTELDPPHDYPWLSLAWKQVALHPMLKRRFELLLTDIPDGPKEDRGNWRLHRFRHTAGTEWLRAIKRIEIVSRLLGHSNVQQTLGYSEIIRDDLHEAVAKAEQEFEKRVAA